jgi:hypothetical protein
MPAFAASTRLASHLDEPVTVVGVAFVQLQYRTLKGP